ncbi:MAG TPA: DNA polymerase III subunit delta [Gemmatimonadaceae bacterium]|nr:DNA polymerase III subunit delta [Gemmatimonadaceae bacterium]
MSSQAQKALKKALQDGAFAPVYYFHGEDDFLKDEAVRRLVARAVDPATRDFNLEQRRGNELDAETLGSLLATPPMMAERRVVVVHDVGTLKKDARAALDQYLRRPASDTVVVLVAPCGVKPDKALCDRAAPVGFDPLKPDLLLKWIEQRAGELGATITPRAARLLQEAVGSDLPQLHAELDKLVSYTRGGAIDEAAVSDAVGVRHGETMGDLLDRIAERDAPRALAILPHVLQQPKASGVTVVMALATQTFALAWGKAMRERGATPGRLAREYYDFLKEGGSVFTGRPWSEAVSAWLRVLDRWTPSALDGALILLLDADCALKETRISSDEQVLTSLVLALCAVDARAAA